MLDSGVGGGPVEIPIPNLSGGVALEAGTSTPTGAEAKAQAAAVRNLSLLTIDVAAANDIQSGSLDNFNVATFGDKDITVTAIAGDPILGPIAAGVNQMIDTLEANLKVTTGGGTLRTTEIDNAIRVTILSNSGWKEAFNKLSSAKQAELIKTIRETGAISAGRRLYTERMVIAQESGAYAAATRKQEEIKKQLTTKTTERTTVEGKINAASKSRDQVTTEREAATHDLETLQGKKTNLTARRESLEAKMDEITARYREENPKTGKVKFNQKDRDLDTEYIKYKGQLDKIQDEINGTGSFAKGIDALIIDAQSEIRGIEQTYQLFVRQDALVTEITALNQQLATADGEVITARTNLANKVNDLLKSLNGVLPEAAKEGMNKYMQTQEAGNRERAIADAKKKAEDATKEGDMMKRAQAEVNLAFQRRYLIPITRRGLAAFLQGRDGYNIDRTLLQQDFQMLITNPDALVRSLMQSITSPVPGYTLTGLSPEVVQYLTAHPETINKLADNVRQESTITIARQAFGNLNIDASSAKKLCQSSPDIATALQQAITSDQTFQKAAESLIGQKLNSKNIKGALERAPAGGLLGLLMMLFGLFGSGLFTAGKK